VFARLTDLLTIGGFLLAIDAMAIFSLRKSPDAQMLIHENRSPAPAPVLPADYRSLKKLPAEVDSYFNDRLAFRDSLLACDAYAKAQFRSTLTGSVIVGKGGWLFHNQAIAENPSHQPHHAKEQFAAWSSEFQTRHDWLAARGIAYLLVITPEKQSVLSDYLPDDIPPEPVWATDLLREWLKKQPIPSLDLRSALRAARSSHSLYFQTDTHWNDNGAYFAYLEIVNYLGARWPEMKPLDLNAFVAERRGINGDLSRMLHAPVDRIEDAEFLSVQNPQARKLNVEVGLDPKKHEPKVLEPQVWGTGDSRRPRCVLFHDSFSQRLLRPTLAEHFELLVYAPTPSIDLNVVERFHPDIVIQQIVERKINWHRPDPLNTETSH
jgi:alginate O-acetyltransferase complex protein AlgJ